MLALVRTRTQRSGTRTPTRCITLVHRVRVPGFGLSTSTKLRHTKLVSR